MFGTKTVTHYDYIIKTDSSFQSASEPRETSGSILRRTTENLAFFAVDLADVSYPKLDGPASHAMKMNVNQQKNRPKNSVRRALLNCCPFMQ